MTQRRIGLIAPSRKTHFPQERHLSSSSRSARRELSPNTLATTASARICTIKAPTPIFAHFFGFNSLACTSAHASSTGRKSIASISHLRSPSIATVGRGITNDKNVRCSAHGTNLFRLNDEFQIYLSAFERRRARLSISEHRLAHSSRTILLTIGTTSHFQLAQHRSKSPPIPIAQYIQVIGRGC